MDVHSMLMTYRPMSWSSQDSRKRCRFSITPVIEGVASPEDDLNSALDKSSLGDVVTRSGWDVTPLVLRAVL
jgi:hypothetical protein